MNEITDLKDGFNIVKGLRNDILNVFDTLQSKVNTLKEIYVKLIEQNNESAYMFGIDSFYFQNKLIENDLKNLTDMLENIENRMYCEYYQLHMLIQQYGAEDVNSSNVRKKIYIDNKYPVYKSLDNRIKYDFDLISELHDHIIMSVVELETYRQEKETELKTDSVQSDLGLNIDNLVNSHLYYNAMLKEKNSMFIRFLKVFNQHHKNYFTTLSTKSQMIIGMINEDIQIKQFNPTGDGVGVGGFPRNDTASKDNASKDNASKDNASKDNTIPTSELDTIVSNIKIKKGNRGINGHGNTSPP